MWKDQSCKQFRHFLVPAAVWGNHASRNFHHCFPIISTVDLSSTKNYQTMTVQNRMWPAFLQALQPFIVFRVDSVNATDNTDNVTYCYWQGTELCVLCITDTNFQSQEKEATSAQEWGIEKLTPHQNRNWKHLHSCACPDTTSKHRPVTGKFVLLN